MFKRQNYVLVFLLSVVLVLLPLFYIYFDIGIEGIFRNFAADSFYYLSVANKYNQLGFFSYDGINPTNGFHPLWQYFLTITLRNISSKESQIIITYLISSTFVVLGISLIVVSFYKLTQNISLVLIGLIPGFFYYIFGFLDLKFLNIWSYANGMESGLSIFFFGILVYLLVFFEWFNNLTYSRIFIISIILTLIYLSRLDDLFLLIPFAVFIFFTNNFRIKPVVIFAIIPTISLISYLLFNYSYSEMLMPVSGTNKLNINFQNLISLLNTIIPIGLIFESKINFWQFWTGSSYRVIQNFVPLLFVFITSILFIKKNNISFFNLNELKEKIINFSINEKLFFTLFIYILIKQLNSLFFINLWHQGAWYYPVVIISINLAIIYILSKYINVTKYSKYILTGFVLFIILNANFYSNMQSSSYDYKFQNPHFQSSLFYSFWNNSKNIEEKLKSENIDKLIEFDDGIMAYSLDINCLSGTGLGLDKISAEKFKDNKFIEYAYSQGFNTIGTIFYHDFNEITSQDKNKLNEYFKFIFKVRYKTNPENWNFELIYFDKKSNSIFLNFEKVK